MAETSQIFMVFKLWQLETASSVPSGDNAIQRTESSRALNERRVLPVAGSRNATIPGFNRTAKMPCPPAAISIRPSCVNWTVWARPNSVGHLARTFPVSTSQTQISSESPGVTNVFPSCEIVRPLTLYIYPASVRGSLFPAKSHSQISFSPAPARVLPSGKNAKSNAPLNESRISFLVRLHVFTDRCKSLDANTFLSGEHTTHMTSSS